MPAIEDALAEIDGVKVAGMINEFRSEFRDIYPDSLLACPLTAVGPMQAFLGLAIKRGHIRDVEKSTK